MTKASASQKDTGHTPLAGIDSLDIFLQSILASVPDAMIVIDQSGRILAFSTAAQRLFGYKAETVLNRNVSCLMMGADADNHDQYIDNYLHTGQRQIIGIGRIVRARLASGETIPVELKIGEATIDGQKIFTGYIRDISEQQANAHRLAQMQVELANFSRLSTVGTMASAMAHELNQPLTAVANYLEASRDLLESPDPETLSLVREALDAAATQSIRAGQIVRRLRDYVSRGELDLRPVRLQTLFEDAISLAKIGMPGRLAQVTLEPAETSLRVYADHVQLRQVIVNLVRNALEALSDTEEPRIWIRTTQHEDTKQVSIAIEDNGPGVSPDHEETLFDAFHSSKPDGMGLGLSICQTLIEAHNSMIGYSGSEEGGARFCFSLRQVQE